MLFLCGSTLSDRSANGPTGPTGAKRANPTDVTGLRASFYSVLVRLIIFDGGQRDGQVDSYEIDEDGTLVFDGPRVYGVYQRADPPRTMLTRKGRADVWISPS